MNINILVPHDADYAEFPIISKLIKMKQNFVQYFQLTKQWWGDDVFPGTFGASFWSE
jgi:hypothetical protein